MSSGGSPSNRKHGGGGRPGRPRLVVAIIIGAAAVALVVVVAVGLLRDGAGTGDPLDPWRAVGRVLTDPTSWRIVALSAATAGAVATLVTLLTRRR